MRLRNITKGTTLYEDFTYSNQPGKTFLIGSGSYKYTAFTNVDIVVPDADLGQHARDPGARLRLLADGPRRLRVPRRLRFRDRRPAGPTGPVDVPTLSEWALILLSLGLGGVAMWSMRGRSPLKLG